eukprot:8867516-Pyramimonas_sp.AAC.1
MFRAGSIRHGPWARTRAKSSLSVRKTYRPDLRVSLILLCLSDPRRARGEMGRRRPSQQAAGFLRNPLAF